MSSTVTDADPLEVVRPTGERVRRTALAILDQLPDPPTGNGLPPGLERDSSRASNTAQHSRVPANAVETSTGTSTRDSHRAGSASRRALARKRTGRLVLLPRRRLDQRLTHRVGLVRLEHHQK